MSFEVGDIAAEIADLESRGVRFEDYDLPELTTVDHVFDVRRHAGRLVPRPDGNMLCLHQPTG